MKKIGLIGGITWQSTQLYYNYLNTMVAEAKGGIHSCAIIMESLDFSAIAAQQAADNWTNLGAEMASTAKRLETAGAELLVICANTMHLSVPFIMEKIDIPIVHIAAATAEAANKKGCRKVLLLGTKHTMEKPFYSAYFQEGHNISVVTPSEKDREDVHRIIYTELAKGIFKKESKGTYISIIERATEQGIDGIVLGCTEIPLLITQEDCDLPVFDTTYIHARAAVDQALDLGKPNIG